jgi:1-deoxy-D-xylulose-5-phosphate reductoisomerase
MKLETNKDYRKGVAILGSTGSIGTQALEVMGAYPELFEPVVLTANNNADLLIEQALKYQPDTVVVTGDEAYKKVREALAGTDVKVFSGENSLQQVVEYSTVDIVLTALVGYSGLLPTLAAIQAGKNIALANKETLVVAGDLITRAAKEKGVNIYPIDSEHSAIFQCITGEFQNPVEKIILTASGGPFRGFTKEQLQKVTPAMALKHPNWDMGAKITIDSATLMNKGLEVIEARWLFALKPEQIEVIVHPQSIIHSMVQFADGSIKAQMGLPDMKIPIQYALSYPIRLKNEFERFSFNAYPSLTFEQPDRETFRCLELAFHALKTGGNAACALNAANEISVRAFLDGRIGFADIARINEETMLKTSPIGLPTLQDYIETNTEARQIAASLL